MISYYIISIISYHIISYHIVLYHIISYHIISYLGQALVSALCFLLLLNVPALTGTNAGTYSASLHSTPHYTA